MKKSVLIAKTTSRMSKTRDALQLMFDNIPKGQQKQIVKVKEVKEMLDRYGVEYGS